MSAAPAPVILAVVLAVVLVIAVANCTRNRASHYLKVID